MLHIRIPQRHPFLGVFQQPANASLGKLQASPAALRQHFNLLSSVYDTTPPA
jgi:hypothetical protein